MSEIRKSIRETVGEAKFSEVKKSFEGQEPRETFERPHELDVVKIDGRWAQAKSSARITYLDDMSDALIDWHDYRMIKDWKGWMVQIVKEITAFSAQELKNIHWGPEEKEHPHLKEVVSVFGEFEKKTK